MVELDRADVQGNILRGYPFPFAAHLFVRITQPARARAFLRRLPVTRATQWDDKPKFAVNVAFSATGLRKLRDCPKLEQRFPEFVQGMAARSTLLGDERSDYEAYWQSAEIWVAVYAEDRALLAQLTQEISRTAGEDVVHIQHAQALIRDGRWFEHFGFRDGISNPEVEGAEDPAKLGPGTGRAGPDGSWLPIRTGEFLLGYENDLGDAGPQDALTQFMKNGTFVVFRKLHQDVYAFRDFLRRAAVAFGVSPELLGAKMMGRTQQGAPLSCPGETAPQDENAFDYGRDMRGHGCPLGAHVRRTQPRATDDRIGISGRHRIIRRGMPYGDPPPDDPQTHTSAAPKPECGLLFIAFNASIEQQFEFIQRFWINASTKSGLSDDWDPIASSRGNARLIIPSCAAPSQMPVLLDGIPQFVYSRGGEYFFMPGIRALESLSE